MAQARPMLTSPALKALEEKNLINNTFKVGKGYKELLGRIEQGSQDLGTFYLQQNCACCCCVNGGWKQMFKVDDGCVQVAQREQDIVFYGEGLHSFDTWCEGFSLKGGQHRLSHENHIQEGNRGLLTVKQGYVGVLSNSGQPIVLPPGIHEWNDPNIVFNKQTGLVDLSQPVIPIGDTMTLVTVEENYAAITSNNGRQQILGGGNAYLLDNAGWQFRGWISLKMQTNRLESFVVTSTDNIALNVNGNVNWRILDPNVAARRNIDPSLGDPLMMIRRDVNENVKSALVELISQIYYGAQDKGQDAGDEFEEEAPSIKESRQAMYDPETTQEVVGKVNEIVSQWGVQVVSVNVVSAQPEDRELAREMSRGAVASVLATEQRKDVRAEEKANLIASEAEVFVAAEQAKVESIEATIDSEIATIAAQGDKDRQEVQARSLLVATQAQADAVKILAEADAEAEKTRADAAKTAGDNLGASGVAVALEKLKIAYAPLLKNKQNNFFFGLKGNGQIPTAIMGEALLKKQGGESAFRNLPR